MNKEKAISRIQQALNVPNRLQGLVLIDEESANMAIEALTEPKTIIGVDIPYESDKGIATIFKHKDDKLILEEVKELMRSWIPCSERLPEPLKAVLITWVNNSPPSYYASMKGVPHTDEAIYFRGDWYWWDSTIVDVLGEYGKMRGIEPIKGIDITAWMELPKPYKEEINAF